jgi:L-lactate dehydrogenase complex protein LldE
MGHDKALDQQQSGAEYVTSSDSSCMMHQQGCAERLGASQKYIHIAQILNGARS